jgi:hypothetical protein
MSRCTKPGISFEASTTSEHRPTTFGPEVIIFFPFLTSNEHLLGPLCADGWAGDLWSPVTGRGSHSVGVGPLRSAQHVGFIVVAWMKSTFHQHGSRHMGSYAGSFSLPPQQSQQGPIKMHQAKCPLRPRRHLRSYLNLGLIFSQDVQHSNPRRLTTIVL